MTDSDPNEVAPDERAADPRSLNRDALVAEVARLRAEMTRQRTLIAQQADAITALQRRASGANGTKASGAAPVPPRPRQIARPVPGFDYVLVFDGGSLGNPGKGYGSYQIVGASGVIAEDRLDFGDKVTNNQAEFRTLVEALETLERRLGADAATASLAVRGDSQLVVNTVTGRWKARHPDLQPLRARAAALLRAFERVDVAWQRRDASVRVLGH